MQLITLLDYQAVNDCPCKGYSTLDSCPTRTSARKRKIQTENPFQSAELLQSNNMLFCGCTQLKIIQSKC